MSKVRSAGVLTIASLFLLCSTATAKNSIYWSDYFDHISFAALDGSDSGDLDVAGGTLNGPAGVAIDSQGGRIYWANRSGSSISYANLDGSGEGGILDTTGATMLGPYGISIADGRIYWANAFVNVISYAALDGTGGGDLDTSGATVNFPAGVAPDPSSGRIYWANYSSGMISYANLDGSGGGNDLNTSGATFADAFGVALDSESGRIYWANNGNNTIGYANVDGSGGGGTLNTTGATPNAPWGVAFDPLSQRVYWGNLAGGSISYANTDGTGGGDLDTSGASLGQYGFPAIQHTPTASKVPAVSGGSELGTSLSCSNAEWSDDIPQSQFYLAPASFTYQWNLDGSPIDGATTNTVTAQETGSYTCAVTGSNQAGSETSTSANHVVTAPTPNTPTVTNTPTNTGSGSSAITPSAAASTITQPLTSPTLAIKQISKDRCVLDLPKRKKFYIPYTLSESAQVTATLLYTSRSVANAGTCRTSKFVKSRPNYKTVRTVLTSGHSGTNLLPINITSDGKRLRPGRYRIRLQARDSRGAVSTTEGRNFLLVWVPRD